MVKVVSTVKFTYFSPDIQYDTSIDSSNECEQISYKFVVLSCQTSNAYNNSSRQLPAVHRSSWITDCTVVSQVIMAQVISTNNHVMHLPNFADSFESFNIVRKNNIFSFAKSYIIVLFAKPLNGFQWHFVHNFLSGLRCSNLKRKTCFYNSLTLICTTLEYFRWFLKLPFLIIKGLH